MSAALLMSRYLKWFVACRLFEKFSDKFKEVKDAARLAREKSQDKELANTALTIAAPQVRTNGKNAEAESRASLCRYPAER